MTGGYRIIPLNEGQEMNYMETFYGTEKEVRLKAQQMMDQLQKILVEASITVKVVDHDGYDITTGVKHY